MKTVKDYLELGLVFVSGDKICGVTGVSYSEELDLFGGKLCEKKSSKGAVKIGVDCYARERWTPSSFAWRNNEGFEPEYKGMIEAECESGNIHKSISSDFMYWWDDGTIIKWRPVVLKSEPDGEYEKIRGSLLSISNGLATSKQFCDALSKAFNPKQTFWNKSVPNLNHPCVAVNIQAIKQVSPKEDKPMKPVYTAEMHAKNEFPPVGAECEALCMDATNSKHAWTKAKILMRHEGDECAVYCIDAGVLRWADEFRPIPKTIKVNGFDVPAPMSENIKVGDKYFFPAPAIERYFQHTYWDGGDFDKLNLARGTIHKTQESAIAHAKAMLGIDPNA